MTPSQAAGVEGRSTNREIVLGRGLGEAALQSVLTVDLERERELHSLFSQSDPARLLEELALLKRLPLVPGETLLFLDEIQACPPALAALRYFFERALNCPSSRRVHSWISRSASSPTRCRWGGSNSCTFTRCPSRNS